MARINILLDDNLKKQADALFDELGLNMTTAFTIFIRQAIRYGGIPFEITVDPFYHPENMRVLEESVRDAEAGKLTVHELIDAESRVGCRTHYGQK